ncbi:MAG: hypothetical protein AB7G21_07545 [Dehalococcoidia bacterium]
MRRWWSVTAAVALVVVPLLTLGGARSAWAAGGFSSPPVFTDSGISLAVFTGGSVDDLQSAASAAGASGVWAQDGRGALHLLVIGGPAFLGQPFRDAIPAGFAGSTAVMLVRTPGASGTPPAATPAPAASPSATPSATPPPAAAVATPAPARPAGVPSASINIYGDLRVDSRTHFAFDFTWIDTLPAIRAGASIAEQEVTFVRACRAILNQPDDCVDELAPPTNSVRAVPKTYLFRLPPRGAAVASVQLCNPRGCDEKVFLGVAVMREDGTMYAVASAYRGATRVRAYVMDTRVSRVRLTYSDGLRAWEVPCGGAGGCSGGSYDDSIAPWATVDGLGVGGAPVGSMRVLYRGTLSDLLRQESAPAPRRAAAAPTLVPRVTPTALLSDRGISVRVGSEQTQSLTALAGSKEMQAPYLSGGVVTLKLPVRSLPENGIARMALIDVADLTTKSPPPAGTEWVAVAHIQAAQSGGPLDEFPLQVMLNFRLEKGALPAETSYRDLSVVHWDGTAWVPASDSIGVNSDGSMDAQVWTQANGLYGVVRAIP